MTIGAIIEARQNSTRLPGKILKDLNGKTVIERIIERLEKIKNLDEIVVATTESQLDDDLCFLLENIKVNYFRGSESNVLSRVYNAAKNYKIDTILEVWGDCPLFDPNINEKLINIYKKNDYDFVGCNIKRTFPLGTDGMVFSTKILETLLKKKLSQNDLEHVSVYIYNHPELFKLYNYESENSKLNRTDIRLTLDYLEDYLLIEKIFNFLKDNDIYKLDSIIKFLDENPDIKNINKDITQINPILLNEKKI